MAKKVITWIGRHRVFVLVAGVLLAVGALAGVVAALLSWGDATGGAGGVTIPALADAGSTGGDLVAVSAASPGREAGQGLAYLEDGTMVVVEDAAELVGRSVDAVVTSSLQTNMGRMIFARLAPED